MPFTKRFRIRPSGYHIRVPYYRMGLGFLDEVQMMWSFPPTEAGTTKVPWIPTVKIMLKLIIHIYMNMNMNIYISIYFIYLFIK